MCKADIPHGLIIQLRSRVIFALARADRVSAPARPHLTVILQWCADRQVIGVAAVADVTTVHDGFGPAFGLVAGVCKVGQAMRAFDPISQFKAAIGNLAVAILGDAGLPKPAAVFVFIDPCVNIFAGLFKAPDPAGIVKKPNRDGGTDGRRKKNIGCLLYTSPSPRDS